MVDQFTDYPVQHFVRFRLSNAIILHMYIYIPIILIYALELNLK